MNWVFLIFYLYVCFLYDFVVAMDFIFWVVYGVVFSDGFGLFSPVLRWNSVRMEEMSRILMFWLFILWMLCYYFFICYKLQRELEIIKTFGSGGFYNCVGLITQRWFNQRDGGRGKVSSEMFLGLNYIYIYIMKKP